MYLHMTTHKTFLLKILLNQTWKTPPLPWKMNPPCKLLVRNPKFLSMPYQGFSAPQTLKLIGYIKHYKVIVLIDSGNTHNFIHRRVAQETHCYVHPISNFQIMIANGGTMKCGGDVKM
jgi:hypothetical protein